ncbi:hypothetical protein [Paeniglutamicibacter terrestris]|uniref:Uncharacterized protein n=1 Tax=Paeniglutamicibacter terrestris TaxID=2723403 RepID=A0ABX1G9N3_9MICC|nr:hypothetical protein [Paeniglutamicibacter terrestris]NKG22396.1 hypothetical protein [Paeniglutamicibacter terrestris]
MGTSSSTLLRAVAASREFTTDNAGTLEAIAEVRGLLELLAAAIDEQQVDVGEIQTALIAAQTTLARIVTTQAARTTAFTGIVATQANHTIALSDITAMQTEHTASLADLPFMKTQIQAIYDAVVTP